MRGSYFLLATAVIPVLVEAGGIRTEVDKKNITLDESFTIRFMLPTTCSYGNVELPESGAYKIVSRDHKQISKLGKINLRSQGGSYSVSKDARGIESQVSYTLRALEAGTLVFNPIEVRCGAWSGETFRMEVLVKPGAGGRRVSEEKLKTSVKSPEPAVAREMSPEELLGKSVSIQDLGSSREASEKDRMARELSALPRAEHAPFSVDGKKSAADPSGQSGADGVLGAIKAVWEFNPFRNSPPLLLVGLFTALLLGYFLLDRAGGLMAYIKKRRSVALMPDISVRTKTQNARSAADQDPVGAVIGGKYELVKQIGSGGMGLVFLAKDLKLGRHVAIKRMLEELRYSFEERGRFLREAMIIARLVHPYIVALHEIIEQDGDTYLVMEYMDGKPLSGILGEVKRLELKECLELFKFVCQAVDYAHRSDVLHLDLKPANIMIERNGFAKVMDFGLAYETKSIVAKSANRSDVGGTLVYMAPEQHLGSPVAASDVYALGVCLYECLTGVRPFAGPNYLDEKERMRFKQPTEVHPGLPKGIDVLMTQLLQPEPKDRLSGVLELLNALKKLEQA